MVDINVRLASFDVLQQRSYGVGLHALAEEFPLDRLGDLCARGGILEIDQHRRSARSVDEGGQSLGSPEDAVEEPEGLRSHDREGHRPLRRLEHDLAVGQAKVRHNKAGVPSHRLPDREVRSKEL